MKHPYRTLIREVSPRTPLGRAPKSAAGDPVEVEDYRLVGRLGPGVYLARSPADEQVLVRLLPADLAAGP